MITFTTNKGGGVAVGGGVGVDMYTWSSVGWVLLGDLCGLGGVVVLGFRLGLRA